MVKKLVSAATSRENERATPPLERAGPYFIRVGAPYCAIVVTCFNRADSPFPSSALRTRACTSLIRRSKTCSHVHNNDAIMAWQEIALTIKRIMVAPDIFVVFPRLLRTRTCRLPACVYLVARRTKNEKYLLTNPICRPCYSFYFFPS